jgi:hypothetical protein
MRPTVILTTLAALLLLIPAGQAVGSTIQENPARNLRQDALEPQSGYDLGWWTVDGGGGASDAATGYRLSGTAGQPDSSAWSGEGYTLGGGFWSSPALIVEHRVNMPLVFRQR